MTQNEARIETLKALLVVAYSPKESMTTRQASWLRFKAICAHYQIDPRSFNVPRQHVTARTQRIVPTWWPMRPTDKVPTYRQPKKARIMPQADSTPKPTPKTQKTAHKNCTHGDTKTDRARCRRHREKAAEKNKDQS
jgi:hypothetical protein